MQKGNLARNALGKADMTGSGLSKSELRDVFTLKETGCDTNDKLNGMWGDYDRSLGLEDDADAVLKGFSVDRKDVVTFIKSGGGRDFATDEGEGLDLQEDDLMENSDDDEGESVGFEGDSEMSKDEEDEDDCSSDSEAEFEG